MPASRLEAIGFDHHRRAQLEALGDALQPGRVVRIDRGAALVQTEDAVVQAALALNADVAVGDFVALDDGGLRHVLPRASSVARLVGNRRETLQLLAANVDLVLIARPLDLPSSARRIQSLVNLAYESATTPIVLLTKSDLVDDASAQVADVLDVAPGVEVVLVSARTGEGVADVRDRCAGRTVVLMGESGAGKSTLINLLLGEAVAETGSTRRDGQGRHTTARRELHALPDGGALIDTPGVREVVGALSAEQLAAGFADVEAFVADCRFSDCGHQGEPGCAVRDGLDAGDLSAARFEAYQAALRDVAWNELRESKRLQAQNRRSYRALERQRRRDSW